MENKNYINIKLNGNKIILIKIQIIIANYFSH